MKKKIAVVVTFLLVMAGNVSFAAGGAVPSLLFSDLTSGPATGGKDDRGAIVTVVGRNFGDRQNDSYVTVGGAKAAAYLSWSDTKISFQPGAGTVSGDIRVTVAGANSNSLPFTVRPGNIYFVSAASPNNPGSGTFADPWRSVSSFISRMRPGDILYLRGGTYGGIVLASGQTNGAAGNEIAFVGFPGETALITNGKAVDFQDTRQYFVVAGLRLISPGETISITGNYIRIVNNYIEGLKNSAYGMIHPTIGHDMQIYGNTFTGATSGNKLDHPIYVGYGADNVDIGWNRIYNNRIDRGPVISVNTDGAERLGYRFENIRIHDNDIDVSGARGIGIVAMQRGSSVYIYNNIFTGDSPLQTVYAYSGSLYMDNNVFYGAPGAAAIQLTPMDDGAGTVYRPETVEIKNNIIYNRGGQYFDIVNESQMGSLTIASNAYYGAGTGPARDGGAVNADPLFVDAAQGNFMLQPNSPCINAGADVHALVPYDKDGYARLGQGAVDMGAFEYGAEHLAASGGGSGDTVNPPEPPVPLSALPVGLNDILVLGSASGRGTVNPDRGETARIYFRGKTAGAYHARICTLAGEPVWEKVLQNVREGLFEWVPRDMASAIYVVAVEGPGMKAVKKLAVLR